MRTQKFEENRIDITLDEFDKLEENHEFSGRYNRKKEALLGAVRKRERNAGKLYYRVAVAAVLAMVLIPTTAFAATKLYNVNVENNGFEATIKVEKNTEISKKEAEKVYAPVKVEFTYLPKGSELDTNSGKYHVSTDEGEARCAHAVTPAELYKLDQDESKIFVPFTVNRWEYSTEDRKVIVFQKDDTFEFNKEVYVLFEDYGYIKKMYLGYGIEDEEVKKIAEGVKLTETTKENATTAYSMETLMQEQRMKGTYKTIEFAKQKNTWHEIGEEVEAYGGYHYKVTDVQVMDDLSQVDKKYFSDWGLEKLEKYADENGVFVPYERRKLIRGDGINTLNKYTEPEMMRKKLVYLTLEFTGGNGEETCTLYQIQFLKSKTERDGDEKNFEEADYFDASPLDNTASHYFWFTLDEGEKKTCHLGFLVDEDKLDMMYLNSSFEGYSGQFVDIRQK